MATGPPHVWTRRRPHLSAVQTGEVSEAEAIQRLSRAPHWVWVAIDPVSKLLLSLDAGDRTLVMAQRLVHQVVQG